MDHQETIQIKKEETDVLPDEPGLVYLEDPLKLEVPGFSIKPDPQLKLCMDSSEINFVIDPLGISGSNSFIKEDPGLSLEAHETGNTFPEDPLKTEVPCLCIKPDPELKLCSSETNFASDPLGISLINNFIKEDPGLSCEADETVLAPKRRATNNTRWSQNSEKRGISLEETLTLGVFPSELEISSQESTQSMMSDTDTQRAVEEKGDEERLRVTRLKCSSRENEFHKFRCSFCLQCFASKYSLTMHVFIHMGGLQPPTYVCKSCGEVFPSDVSLTKHMKASESDQSSSAALIDQFDHIDKHINVEGDQELSVVRLTKQQSSEMKSRAFPTTGTRSFKCYDCGMTFSYMGNLKRHKHTRKPAQKCTICQKSFPHLSDLKRHTLIHTGQRPHKCHVCGKSFTVLGTLKNHALTHTGQRPHKCNVCAKSFTELCTLRRHASVHTGQRPHKCNVCGKSFTRLSGLKVHSLIHTGQRPHKCNVCGKSFTQLTTFKRHSQTHTGQQPHKCNVCGKSFTRLSGLKKHASKHTE